MIIKFEGMDEGPMKEFIWCVRTMSRNQEKNAKLKFTQLVLIHSLRYESKILDDRAPSVPATQGMMLARGADAFTSHGNQV